MGRYELITGKKKETRPESIDQKINRRGLLINSFLRNKGYDVRVTEIKGLLQDSLEQLFKEYVEKETGRDLAYDIKKIRKEEIGKIYYQILNWGKEHAPHLLKSGWRSLNI